MVKVKICGLTRPSDAEAALSYGADLLGFNFEPTSPRYLGDQVPEWISSLRCQRVAVFGPFRPDVDLSRFDYVQAISWDGAPSKPDRIQVVRLRAGDAARSFPPIDVGVRLVLFDAWRENAYGGTGDQVDWGVAAAMSTMSEFPVILAGGLTPENVAEAVRIVRPFAVDVSSGVESEKGIKDMGKVRAFIEAAKGA